MKKHMRRIPAAMATQHPDNAAVPYWKEDENPFVSVADEPRECVECLQGLGVREFMWDWEGKYADEAVIERLFSQYYGYFKDHLLGRDAFLTFRLPNIWEEKGYSLIRALMVILTSEDVARDLSYRSRPLFEAILPMTKRPQQLMYIQNAFRKLARFKAGAFPHAGANTDYLEIIPLVEAVEDQLGIRNLLERYVRMHRRAFGAPPAYLRPFFARSDPALVSGFVPNVLANKIALSDSYAFAREGGIPVYPIIGAGSLVFRGGFSPARAAAFLDEYAGVRTVTVQSAFRYDHPRALVRRALARLQKSAPRSHVREVGAEDRALLLGVIRAFERSYQSALAPLLPDLEPFFQAVPRRRERRQHIGFLSYKRRMGSAALPRAINFTAACYSLGVPPEFFGLGRALASLSASEREALSRHYRRFRADVIEAGRYLNTDNLRALAKGSAAWAQILRDVEETGRLLSATLGPRTTRERLHRNLTSELFLRRRDKRETGRLIAESGILRRSLG